MLAGVTRYTGLKIIDLPKGQTSAGPVINTHMGKEVYAFPEEKT